MSGGIFCDPTDEESLAILKSQTCKIINFTKDYQWLIDAYVSDFFVSNHWQKVKPSWSDCLDAMELQELATLLHHDTWLASQVWPLSLLAFRATAHSLSLSKNPVESCQEVISKFCHADNLVSARKKECGDHISATGHAKTDKGVDPVVETGGDSEDPSWYFQRQSDSVKFDNKLVDGQLLVLEHCYRRHVKPKKQHEIQSLAEVIKLMSEACGCRHVVDVGAGQGHLSRLLSFGYGLGVTTIEAAGCHAPKAEKFDKEVKRDISQGQRGTEKKMETLQREDIQQVCSGFSKNEAASPLQPNHVVAWIDADISVSDFLNQMVLAQTNVQSRSSCTANRREAQIGSAQCQNQITDGTTALAGRTAPPFLLTGLHACGDLTPTMLRVFVNCPQALGLASVACCYMKMDIHVAKRGDHKLGYPMSTFVSSLPDCHLSWEAREMACHFIEAYRTRLNDAAEEPEGVSMAHLRTHCYRAALQEIITEKDPNITHGSIKLTQRKAHQLPFSDYADKALRRLGLDSSLSEDALKRVERRLISWKKVVAFYTLRLSLAGTLETIILLDRMLFLADQGIRSALVPIFDPALSPRNFVLLASKPS